MIVAACIACAAPLAAIHPTTPEHSGQVEPCQKSIPSISPSNSAGIYNEAIGRVVEKNNINKSICTVFIEKDCEISLNYFIYRISIKNKSGKTSKISLAGAQYMRFQQKYTSDIGIDLKKSQKYRILYTKNPTIHELPSEIVLACPDHGESR